jgi:hypothetical protein
MDELQLYAKDGLFHQIVKQSAIMNGRYAVLEKGSHDLNLNNLLSGLDIPSDKYPIVACLPPVSELPCSLKGSNAWESFNFRLLFLTRTYNTGDNQVKFPDRNNNSSLHSIAMDWADMKRLARAFMNALETVQVRLRGEFRLSQKDTWKFIPVSVKQNDVLSGVLLLFSGSIAAPCEFTDINIQAIELPTATHEEHFH